MSEDFKLDGAQPVMVPIKLETLQAIAQMLFVDLTEGEFEHDCEYRKVERLLTECHEALRNAPTAGGKGASQPEEIDPRLKAIAEHYGLETMKKIAVTVMEYLIFAIKVQDGDIVEKVAEVITTIEQLAYLIDKYAPEDYDVKSEVEIKIERQLKRIEDEKELA